jgi:hypothetical protein
MAKDPLKEMQRLADLVGEGKITVAEYEVRKAALFGDEVPSSRVPPSDVQALSQTSVAPQRALVAAAAVAVAIVGIAVAIFVAVDGGTSDVSSTETGLELLYEGCVAGSSSDCDMLYYSSPLDSEYESESLVCGGRTASRNPQQATCMVEEDALDELDDVRTQCRGGFYAACDLMYYISPIGSEDETFGATCAGLMDPEDTATCVSTYGFGSRD